MRNLFIIILLVFIAASCTNNQETIRKEINLGVKELYKGDLTSAVQRFSSVIEMDSTNCEAHLYLGRAYFNQGKNELAMKEYNTAIRHNPKYGEAYRSRAQLWFVLGSRPNSCRDYLRAKKFGVKNLENYTGHCEQYQDEI